MHVWDGNFEDLVIYIGNQQPLSVMSDGSVTLFRNKEEAINYQIGDAIGENIIPRSQIGQVPDGSKHYLKFKKTKDGTFRKDFHTSTGQYIDRPYVSTDGLWYIWGTDKLTLAKITALRLKYPLSLWVGDNPPT